MAWNSLTLPKRPINDEIPVPPAAPVVPSSGLPSWTRLPWDAKIPMPRCPKGEVTLSRGKLGEKLHTSYPNHEFTLWDPHNYSNTGDTEYNSLTDPHLKHHFLNSVRYKDLVRRGELTPDGRVICSLIEYNKYRKYLYNLWGLEVDRLTRNQLIKERQRLDVKFQKTQEPVYAMIPDYHDREMRAWERRLLTSADGQRSKSFSDIAIPRRRCSSASLADDRWMRYHAELIIEYKEHYGDVAHWLDDTTKCYRNVTLQRIAQNKAREDKLREKWERLREHNVQLFEEELKIRAEEDLYEWKRREKRLQDFQKVWDKHDSDLNENIWRRRSGVMQECERVARKMKKIRAKRNEGLEDIQVHRRRISLDVKKTIQSTMTLLGDNYPKERTKQPDEEEVKKEHIARDKTKKSVRFRELQAEKSKEKTTPDLENDREEILKEVRTAIEEHLLSVIHVDLDASEVVTSEDSSTTSVLSDAKKQRTQKQSEQKTKTSVKPPSKSTTTKIPSAIPTYKKPEKLPSKKSIDKMIKKTMDKIPIKKPFAKPIKGPPMAKPELKAEKISQQLSSTLPSEKPKADVSSIPKRTPKKTKRPQRDENEGFEDNEQPPIVSDQLSEALEPAPQIIDKEAEKPVQQEAGKVETEVPETAMEEPKLPTKPSSSETLVPAIEDETVPETKATSPETPTQPTLLTRTLQEKTVPTRILEKEQKALADESKRAKTIPTDETTKIKLPQLDETMINAPVLEGQTEEVMSLAEMKMQPISGLEALMEQATTEKHKGEEDDTSITVGLSQPMKQEKDDKIKKKTSSIIEKPSSTIKKSLDSTVVEEKLKTSVPSLTKEIKTDIDKAEDIPSKTGLISAIPEEKPKTPKTKDHKRKVSSPEKDKLSDFPKTKPLGGKTAAQEEIVPKTELPKKYPIEEEISTKETTSLEKIPTAPQKEQELLDKMMKTIKEDIHKTEEKFQDIEKDTTEVSSETELPPKIHETIEPQIEAEKLTRDEVLPKTEPIQEAEVELPTKDESVIQPTLPGIASTDVVPAVKTTTDFKEMDKKIIQGLSEGTTDAIPETTPETPGKMEHREKELQQKDTIKPATDLIQEKESLPPQDLIQTEDSKASTADETIQLSKKEDTETVKERSLEDITTSAEESKDETEEDVETEDTTDFIVNYCECFYYNYIPPNYNYHKFSKLIHNNFQHPLKFSKNERLNELRETMKETDSILTLCTNIMNMAAKSSTSKEEQIEDGENSFEALKYAKAASYIFLQDRILPEPLDDKELDEVIKTIKECNLFVNVPDILQTSTVLKKVELEPIVRPSDFTVEDRILPDIATEERTFDVVNLDKSKRESMEDVDAEIPTKTEKVETFPERKTKFLQKEAVIFPQLGKTEIFVPETLRQMQDKTVDSHQEIKPEFMELESLSPEKLPDSAELAKEPFEQRSQPIATTKPAQEGDVQPIQQVEIKPAQDSKVKHTEKMKKPDQERRKNRTRSVADIKKSLESALMPIEEVISVQEENVKKAAQKRRATLTESAKKSFQKIRFKSLDDQTRYETPEEKIKPIAEKTTQKPVSKVKLQIKETPKTSVEEKKEVVPKVQSLAQKMKPIRKKSEIGKYKKISKETIQKAISKTEFRAVQDRKAKKTEKMETPSPLIENESEISQEDMDDTRVLHKKTESILDEQPEPIPKETDFLFESEETKFVEEAKMITADKVTKPVSEKVQIPIQEKDSFRDEESMAIISEKVAEQVKLPERPAHEEKLSLTETIKAHLVFEEEVTRTLSSEAEELLTEEKLKQLMQDKTLKQFEANIIMKFDDSDEIQSTSPEKEFAESNPKHKIQALEQKTDNEESNPKLTSGNPKLTSGNPKLTSGNSKLTSDNLKLVKKNGSKCPENENNDDNKRKEVTYDIGQIMGADLILTEEFKKRSRNLTSDDEEQSEDAKRLKIDRKPKIMETKTATKYDDDGRKLSPSSDEEKAQTHIQIYQDTQAPTSKSNEDDEYIPVREVQLQVFEKFKADLILEKFHKITRESTSADSTKPSTDSTKPSKEEIIGNLVQRRKLSCIKADITMKFDHADEVTPARKPYEPVSDTGAKFDQTESTQETEHEKIIKKLILHPVIKDTFKSAPTEVLQPGSQDAMQLSLENIRTDFEKDDNLGKSDHKEVIEGSTKQLLPKEIEEHEPVVKGMQKRVRGEKIIPEETTTEEEEEKRPIKKAKTTQEDTYKSTQKDKLDKKSEKVLIKSGETKSVEEKDKLVIPEKETTDEGKIQKLIQTKEIIQIKTETTKKPIEKIKMEIIKKTQESISKDAIQKRSQEKDIKITLDEAIRLNIKELVDESMIKKPTTSDFKEEITEVKLPPSLITKAVTPHFKEQIADKKPSLTEASTSDFKENITDKELKPSSAEVSTSDFKEDFTGKELKPSLTEVSTIDLKEEVIDKELKPSLTEASKPDFKEDITDTELKPSSSEISTSDFKEDFTEKDLEPRLDILETEIQRFPTKSASQEVIRPIKIESVKKITKLLLIKIIDKIQKDSEKAKGQKEKLTEEYMEHKELPETIHAREGQALVRMDEMGKYERYVTKVEEEVMIDQRGSDKITDETKPILGQTAEEIFEETSAQVVETDTREKKIYSSETGITKSVQEIELIKPPEVQQLSKKRKDERDDMEVQEEKEIGIKRRKSIPETEQLTSEEEIESVSDIKPPLTSIDNRIGKEIETFLRDIFPRILQKKEKDKAKHDEEKHDYKDQEKPSRVEKKPLPVKEKQPFEKTGKLSSKEEKSFLEEKIPRLEKEKKPVPRKRKHILKKEQPIIQEETPISKNGTFLTHRKPILEKEELVPGQEEFTLEKEKILQLEKEKILQLEKEKLLQEEKEIFQTKDIKIPFYEKGSEKFFRQEKTKLYDEIKSYFEGKLDKSLEYKSESLTVEGQESKSSLEKETFPVLEDKIAVFQEDVKRPLDEIIQTVEKEQKAKADDQLKTLKIPETGILQPTIEKPLERIDMQILIPETGILQPTIEKQQPEKPLETIDMQIPTPETGILQPTIEKQRPEKPLETIIDMQTPLVSSRTEEFTKNEMKDFVDNLIENMLQIKISDHVVEPVTKQDINTKQSELLHTQDRKDQARSRKIRAKIHKTDMFLHEKEPEMELQIKKLEADETGVFMHEKKPEMELQIKKPEVNTVLTDKIEIFHTPDQASVFMKELQESEEADIEKTISEEKAEMMELETNGDVQKPKAKLPVEIEGSISEEETKKPVPTEMVTKPTVKETEQQQITTVQKIQPPFHKDTEELIEEVKKIQAIDKAITKDEILTTPPTIKDEVTSPVKYPNLDETRTPDEIEQIPKPSEVFQICDVVPKVSEKFEHKEASMSLEGIKVKESEVKKKVAPIELILQEIPKKDIQRPVIEKETSKYEQKELPETKIQEHAEIQKIIKGISEETEKLLHKETFEEPATDQEADLKPFYIEEKEPVDKKKIRMDSSEKMEEKKRLEEKQISQLQELDLESDDKAKKLTKRKIHIEEKEMARPKTEKLQHPLEPTIEQTKKLPEKAKQPYIEKKEKELHEVEKIPDAMEVKKQYREKMEKYFPEETEQLFDKERDTIRQHFHEKMEKHFREETERLFSKETETTCQHFREVINKFFPEETEKLIHKEEEIIPRKDIEEPTKIMDTEKKQVIEEEKVKFPPAIEKPHGMVEMEEIVEGKSLHEEKASYEDEGKLPYKIAAKKFLHVEFHEPLDVEIEELTSEKADTFELEGVEEFLRESVKKLAVEKEEKLIEKKEKALIGKKITPVYAKIEKLEKPLYDEEEEILSEEDILPEEIEKPSLKQDEKLLHEKTLLEQVEKPSYKEEEQKEEPVCADIEKPVQAVIEKPLPEKMEIPLAVVEKALRGKVLHEKFKKRTDKEDKEEFLHEKEISDKDQRKPLHKKQKPLPKKEKQAIDVKVKEPLHKKMEKPLDIDTKKPLLIKKETPMLHEEEEPVYQVAEKSIHEEVGKPVCKIEDNEVETLIHEEVKEHLLEKIKEHTYEEIERPSYEEREILPHEKEEKSLHEEAEKRTQGEVEKFIYDIVKKVFCKEKPFYKEKLPHEKLEISLPQGVPFHEKIKTYYKEQKKLEQEGVEKRIKELIYEKIEKPMQEETEIPMHEKMEKSLYEEEKILVYEEIGKFVHEEQPIQEEVEEPIRDVVAKLIYDAVQKGTHKKRGKGLDEGEEELLHKKEEKLLYEKRKLSVEEGIQKLLHEGIEKSYEKHEEPLHREVKKTICDEIEKLVQRIGESPIHEEAKKPTYEIMEKILLEEKEVPLHEKAKKFIHEEMEKPIYEKTEIPTHEKMETALYEEEKVPTHKRVETFLHEETEKPIQEEVEKLVYEVVEKSVLKETEVPYHKKVKKFIPGEMEKHVHEETEIPTEEKTGKPLHKEEKAPTHKGVETLLHEETEKPIQEEVEKLVYKVVEKSVLEKKEAPLHRKVKKFIHEEMEKPIRVKTEITMQEKMGKPLYEEEKVPIHKGVKTLSHEEMEKPIQEELEIPMHEKMETALYEEEKVSTHKRVQTLLHEETEKPIQEEVEKLVYEVVEKSVLEETEVPLHKKVKKFIPGEMEKHIYEETEIPTQEKTGKPLHKEEKEPTHKGVETLLHEETEKPIHEEVEKLVYEAVEKSVLEEKEAPLHRKIKKFIHEEMEKPIRVKTEITMQEKMGKPLYEEEKVHIHKGVKTLLHEEMEKPIQEEVEKLIYEAVEKSVFIEKILLEEKEVPPHEKAQKFIHEEVKKPIHEELEIPMHEKMETALYKEEKVPTHKRVETLLHEETEKTIQEEVEKLVNEVVENSVHEDMDKQFQKEAEKFILKKTQKALHEEEKLVFKKDEKLPYEILDIPSHEKMENVLYEKEKVPIHERVETLPHEKMEKHIQEQVEEVIHEEVEKSMHEEVDKRFQKGAEKLTPKILEKALYKEEEKPHKKDEEKPYKKDEKLPREILEIRLPEKIQKPLYEEIKKPCFEKEKKPLHKEMEKPLREKDELIHAKYALLPEIEKPILEKENLLQDVKNLLYEIKQSISQKMEKPLLEEQERPLRDERELFFYKEKEKLPEEEAKELLLYADAKTPIKKEEMEEPLRKRIEKHLDDKDEKHLQENIEKPLYKEVEKVSSEKKEKLIEKVEKLSQKEIQKPLYEEKILYKETEKLPSEKIEKPSIEEMQKLLIEEKEKSLYKEIEKISPEKIEELSPEKVQKPLTEEKEKLLIEEKEKLLIEEKEKLLIEEKEKLLIEEKEKLLYKEIEKISPEKTEKPSEEIQKPLHEKKEKPLYKKTEKLSLEVAKSLVEEIRKPSYERREKPFYENEKKLLDKKREKSLDKEVARKLHEEEKEPTPKEAEKLLSVVMDKPAHESLEHFRLTESVAEVSAKVEQTQYKKTEKPFLDEDRPLDELKLPYVKDATAASPERKMNHFPHKEIKSYKEKIVDVIYEEAPQQTDKEKELVQEEEKAYHEEHIFREKGIKTPPQLPDTQKKSQILQQYYFSQKQLPFKIGAYVGKASLTAKLKGYMPRNGGWTLKAHAHKNTETYINLMEQENKLKLLLIEKNLIPRRKYEDFYDVQETYPVYDIEIPSEDVEKLKIRIRYKLMKLQHMYLKHRGKMLELSNRSSTDVREREIKHIRPACSLTEEQKDAISHIEVSKIERDAFFSRQDRFDELREQTLSNTHLSFEEIVEKHLESKSLEKKLQVSTSEESDAEYEQQQRDKKKVVMEHKKSTYETILKPSNDISAGISPRSRTQVFPKTKKKSRYLKVQENYSEEEDDTSCFAIKEEQVSIYDMRSSTTGEDTLRKEQLVDREGLIALEKFKLPSIQRLKKLETIKDLQLDQRNRAKPKTKVVDLQPIRQITMPHEPDDLKLHEALQVQKSSPEEDVNLTTFADEITTSELYKEPSTGSICDITREEDISLKPITISIERIKTVSAPTFLSSKETQKQELYIDIQDEKGQLLNMPFIYPPPLHKTPTNETAAVCQKLSIYESLMHSSYKTKVEPPKTITEPKKPTSITSSSGSTIETVIPDTAYSISISKTEYPSAVPDTKYSLPMPDTKYPSLDIQRKAEETNEKIPRKHLVQRTAQTEYIATERKISDIDIPSYFNIEDNELFELCQLSESMTKEHTFRKTQIISGKLLQKEGGALDSKEEIQTTVESTEGSKKKVVTAAINHPGQAEKLDLDKMQKEKTLFPQPKTKITSKDQTSLSEPMTIEYHCHDRKSLDFTFHKESFQDLQKEEKDDGKNAQLTEELSLMSRNLGTFFPKMKLISQTKGISDDTDLRTDYSDKGKQKVAEGHDLQILPTEQLPKSKTTKPLVFHEPTIDKEIPTQYIRAILHDDDDEPQILQKEDENVFRIEDDEAMTAYKIKDSIKSEDTIYVDYLVDRKFLDNGKHITKPSVSHEHTVDKETYTQYIRATLHDDEPQILQKEDENVFRIKDDEALNVRRTKSSSTDEQAVFIDRLVDQKLLDDGQLTKPLAFHEPTVDKEPHMQYVRATLHDDDKQQVLKKEDENLFRIEDDEAVNIRKIKSSSTDEQTVLIDRLTEQKLLDDEQYITKSTVLDESTMDKKTQMQYIRATLHDDEPQVLQKEDENLFRIEDEAIINVYKMKGSISDDHAVFIDSLVNQKLLQDATLPPSFRLAERAEPPKLETTKPRTTQESTINKEIPLLGPDIAVKAELPKLKIRKSSAAYEPGVSKETHTKYNRAALDEIEAIKVKLIDETEEKEVISVTKKRDDYTVPDMDVASEGIAEVEEEQWVYGSDGKPHESIHTKEMEPLRMPEIKSTDIDFTDTPLSFKETSNVCQTFDISKIEDLSPMPRNFEQFTARLQKALEGLAANQDTRTDTISKISPYPDANQRKKDVSEPVKPLSIISPIKMPKLEKKLTSDEAKFLYPLGSQEKVAMSTTARRITLVEDKAEHFEKLIKNFRSESLKKMDDKFLQELPKSKLEDVPEQLETDFIGCMPGKTTPEPKTLPKPKKDLPVMQQAHEGLSYEEYKLQPIKYKDEDKICELKESKSELKAKIDYATLVKEAYTVQSDESSKLNVDELSTQKLFSSEIDHINEENTKFYKHIAKISHPLDSIYTEPELPFSSIAPECEDISLAYSKKFKFHILQQRKKSFGMHDKPPLHHAQIKTDAVCEKILHEDDDEQMIGIKSAKYRILPITDDFEFIIMEPPEELSAQIVSNDTSVATSKEMQNIVEGNVFKITSEKYIKNQQIQKQYQTGKIVASPTTSMAFPGQSQLFRNIEPYENEMGSIPHEEHKELDTNRTFDEIDLTQAMNLCNDIKDIVTIQIQNITDPVKEAESDEGFTTSSEEKKQCSCSSTVLGVLLNECFEITEATTQESFQSLDEQQVVGQQYKECPCSCIKKLSSD